MIVKSHWGNKVLITGRREGLYPIVRIDQKPVPYKYLPDTRVGELFDWGYYSPGAYILSLSLLCAIIAEPQDVPLAEGYRGGIIATQLYPKFLRTYVRKWEDPFEIQVGEVLSWLRKQKE